MAKTLLKLAEPKLTLVHPCSLSDHRGSEETERKETENDDMKEGSPISAKNSIMVITNPTTQGIVI